MTSRHSHVAQHASDSLYSASSVKRHEHAVTHNMQCDATGNTGRHSKNTVTQTGVRITLVSMN